MPLGLHGGTHIGVGFIMAVYTGTFIDLKCLETIVILVLPKEAITSAIKTRRERPVPWNTRRPNVCGQG